MYLLFSVQSVGITSIMNCVWYCALNGLRKNLLNLLWHNRCLTVVLCVCLASGLRFIASRMDLIRLLVRFSNWRFHLYVCFNSR
jgi:hypothetical protein